MFGVVPRTMWEKMNPPDVNNLCTWAMRALLVQTGARTILIDTGIGNKQDEKFRTHFEPHGAEDLLSSLQQAGVSPEAITDVLLTHLHFDHCGGALRKNAQGQVEPTFPRAIYWSNEKHWAWACNPNAREKASFLADNFKLLHDEGRLSFVPEKQEYAFDTNIHIRFVYGHTEAMMVPTLFTPGGSVIYCADSLPSRWHIGMPYVMAYDIRPLVTLEEKAVLLNRAADDHSLLFFEHDPGREAGRVAREPSGRIVLADAGLLRDLIP